VWNGGSSSNLLQVSSLSGSAGRSGYRSEAFMSPLPQGSNGPTSDGLVTGGPAAQPRAGDGSCRVPGWAGSATTTAAARPDAVNQEPLVGVASPLGLVARRLRAVATPM
jgi:hypothetical protein